MNQVIASFLLVVAVSPVLFSQVGSRSTAFRPEVNRLKFVNSLQVEVVNDVRMPRFCRGMVYMVLNYYKTERNPARISSCQCPTLKAVYRQRPVVYGNCKH